MSHFHADHINSVAYTPSAPVHVVLCADCGIPIQPNSANLCIGCLRNTVDITAEIPKQSTLTFCRGCERYSNPPAGWAIAEWESRELLAICLKKLKGLSKVRLIDASFIWTEPHSKRVKVKLTVQKEVLANTILQQIFEVTYVVLGAQCPDCARLAAKNTWKATVQVRQKVPHKRTFFFLEQLILKHNAHKETINISEKKDGLDFFYTQRSHAVKMVEFLSSVTPVRTKTSEQLLSTDTHSGTSSYKFSYSVELVPVCKDDLVCLPKKMAQSLSNIPPLTVCTRIGNSIHLLDPMTLHTADVTSPVYWRQPFESLASVTDLVEFVVLDIEPSGPTKGRWVLADAQVTRSTGEGADAIYHTRTHLGAILQPGDTVMGYHLTHANFNNDAFEALDESALPDVVLVKKSYPNRRKKSKPRKWRLKSIAKEAEDASAEGTYGRGALGRRGGVDQQKVERDYELFLRDLEEDPEMRQGINLYRSDEPGAHNAVAKQYQMRDPNAMEEDVSDEDMDNVSEADAESEGDFPDIADDELLAEEMDEMQIGDDAGEEVA